MTFAKKIFIAVFASTLILGSLLIWTGYRYTVSRSEDEFISRYQVFTRVLADTLSRLDTSTEALMLNAAQVVVEKDAKHGLLSTDYLRDLQTKLGITHLFIVNKAGQFVRSTNDDPKGIPNLFSFCENYRKLITGELIVEATPIIKPNPEPKPFKFLSIANHDRSRIVEVGVRVDFIAKTLTEAIKSDKNVEAMSLFAPDGTPFGTFSEKNVVFEEQKARLPESFDLPVNSSGSVNFYTKVISSHPRCCQCDASGTSKNGEYYYVLENKVSKAELKAIQASAGILFLLIGVGNGVFSWILARLLSRRLVRNIEAAVNKVRRIKDHGDVRERIQMNRGDEISFLTQEFDRLLDSLEQSQKQLVEAEKNQSKVDLAKVVAHNIKSPLLAIEMMLPGLVNVPDRMRRVLKNSVKEIKELTNKLKTDTASVAQSSANELDTDLVFLPIFMADLVEQKELEFSKRSSVSIVLEVPNGSEGLFVKASSLDLKAVMSNLINNAVDSYGTLGGKVCVRLHGEGNHCVIAVSDSGSGIPADYIPKLGKHNITFKGERGSGLGLVHAFGVVESWGGSISIDSELGRGTSIAIRLLKYRAELGRSTDGNVIQP